MSTSVQQDSKTDSEHRVEHITLGLVLFILGLSMFGLLPTAINGVGAILIGLVLLGSGTYQALKGWAVGKLTWIVGFVALALGLGTNVGFLVGSATAAAVLLLGVWLVGRGLGLEI